MATVQLITTDEYAAIRHCSPRTIERERAAGTGCRYIKIGRLVLYRVSDVEEFLNAHVRHNTSEPETAISGRISTHGGRGVAAQSAKSLRAIRHC